MISAQVTEPGSDRTGRDVVLLHAGVTDQRSWSSVVKALSTRHRCITLDERGFGTTTYGPEEGWSPVEDALRVIDAAGVEHAVLVGSSLGGGTAIDLALSQPGRVDALVLIAPAVRGAPYPPPTKTETDLEEQAERAQEAGRIDEANRFEARLWLDGPAAPEGRVSGPARELFLTMNAQALRSPKPGRMAPREDAWPRLGQITVPTLVLAGDLDASDVQAIATRMATVMPRAEFVQLRGVAHLPQLEAPAQLVAAITEFLATLDAAAE